MRELMLAAMVSAAVAASGLPTMPGADDDVRSSLALMASRSIVPSLPQGAVRYKPAKWTQSIAVVNGQDRIEGVLIENLPDKRWHQSGGMAGIDRSLWISEKFKTLPSPEREWIGDITVRNSLGYDQQNRGHKRQYADGSRFDDVLRNAVTGQVFEHRVRKKVNGRWSSKVVYSNPSARPKGYTGLTATCASCQDEAGTGKYDAGLVPGGDTVLSDPFDW